MTFETIPLPRKNGINESGKYRVYKDSAEFMLVPAETALEAMKASGLATVHKIERDAIDFNKVMNPKFSVDVLLGEKKEAAPAPDAAAAPAPIETAPAAAEAAKA